MISNLKSRRFLSDFTRESRSRRAIDLDLKHLAEQGGITGDMHGLIMRGATMKLIGAVADAVGQHFNRLAQILFVECLLLTEQQFLQFLQALIHDFFSDKVLHVRRRRAGAGAVFE